MKIGDEVYVHGYVDEIRNDVIIISNDGGYFGTVPTEIVESDGEEYKRGRLDALSELKAYIREMETYDTADSPQTDRQRLEGKRWTDALTTEEKKCMLDALDFTDTPQNGRR